MVAKTRNTSFRNSIFPSRLSRVVGARVWQQPKVNRIYPRDQCLGGWPRLYPPAQPAPGVPHSCASFAQEPALSGVEGVGNHTDRTMGFAFDAACAPKRACIRLKTKI